MNKKGFTLVEILAVIVILSLVIITITTNGFGVFNKAKDKIIEENYKTIKEASNLLMIEVVHCDDSFDEELYKSFNKENCEKLKEQASSNSCLKIPLSYLIDNSYLTNSDSKDVLKTDPEYYTLGCIDKETNSITIKKIN